jgi:F0F1-type ATP synthase epsilon subunit
VPFQLTIVTPQGSMFDGPVENVVLPGTEGDFGVPESHDRAEQGLSELGADANEKRRLEFEAALERARNRLTVAKRG